MRSKRRRTTTIARCTITRWLAGRAAQATRQIRPEWPHLCIASRFPRVAVRFTTSYPFSFTFLLWGRGLALPILPVFRSRTGVRGGIVKACAAAIDVAETPDLAFSRQNHARLCGRARV